MNLFPLILVILYENTELAQKYLKFDMSDIIKPNEFLFMIAALLLFTLSYEMVKATMFASEGTGTWVDFATSFALLVAIIVYIIKIVMQGDSKPTMLILLVAEAQLLDVIVGFYLVISNARRDFNAGS
jgi:hypothetical protein